jgi:hypothetical protein
MASRWALLLVGVWVLLSPWILGFSGIAVAKWSNVLAGLVIALVNAWVIFGSEPPAMPSEDLPSEGQPSERNGRRSRKQPPAPPAHSVART